MIGRRGESVRICWQRVVDDSELFYMFRQMLVLKLQDKDPFDDSEADIYRHYLTRKEREKIFKIFSERYPEITELMTKIMTDSGSLCGCPFPFDCKNFPCETLVCHADELDNGYPFRRS